MPVRLRQKEKNRKQEIRRRNDFAFRRLYDARSALAMIAHGVTEFATANIKDYEGFGFRKVWDPLPARA
jgi:hypothetical protein